VKRNMSGLRPENGRPRPRGSATKA
jgi:hypothetical protein